MVDFNNLVLGVAAILFLDRPRLAGGLGLQDLLQRLAERPGFVRPRDKRLGVVETASVDAKRKLLLVRRDDVEHLVMIGGPIDMLIETGIKGRPASRTAARGRDHRQERDEART